MKTQESGVAAQGASERVTLKGVLITNQQLPETFQRSSLLTCTSASCRAVATPGAPVSMHTPAAVFGKAPGTGMGWEQAQVIGRLRGRQGR